MNILNIEKVDKIKDVNYNIMQYLKSRFDKSCIPLAEYMTVETSDTSDTLLEEPNPSTAIPQPEKAKPLRDFSNWQEVQFSYKDKYSFDLSLHYYNNDCMFVYVYTPTFHAHTAMKTEDFYSTRTEIYARVYDDIVQILILKTPYNNQPLGKLYPGGYYDVVRTDQVDKFKSFMDEYSEYRKSRQK